MKENIYAFAFTIAFQILIKVGFAQDTMQFRNGKLLEVSISEITPNEIKYTMAKDSSGMNYSESKNHVAFVKYKNGALDIFDLVEPSTIPVDTLKTIPVAMIQTPKIIKFGNTYSYDQHLINKKLMYTLLLSVHNEKITMHINKAKRQKRWQNIGYASAPLGLISIACLYVYMEEEDIPTTLMSGGIFGALSIACISTSITMKSKRNENEKSALKLFHDNY